MFFISLQFKDNIVYRYKKSLPKLVSFFILEAERQGFEPRVPRSTTVFKTAAIDHSATSPKPQQVIIEVLYFSKAMQR